MDVLGEINKRNHTFEELYIIGLLYIGGSYPYILSFQGK